MTLDEQETPAAQIQPAGGRLRRHGWPILAAVTGTVAVPMAVFVATGSGESPESFVATLLATLAWVALASPIFAAGAGGWFWAFFRGGCVVDASGAVLMVLWLSSGSSAAGESYITFFSVMRIYCIYAAVGLAGVAATRCSRSVTGRHASAIVFVVAVFAALSTPMWVNGLLNSTTGRTSDAIVTCAVYVNPAYSVFSATSESIGYVWHARGLMYNLTIIGQDGSAAPPPVQWYTAVVVWGAIAGILAATTLLHRRGAAT